MIIKNPAGTTVFIAVGQVEIIVAPALVVVVVDAWTIVAGGFHGSMEIDRVLIFLRAASIKDRSQVGTAAEPLLARHDHAGVHVDGGDVGIPGVNDQRDA